MIRPLVILVGGATGTGKSTVATELAHRHGITRVTSTDSIRQTMRAFFPREEMPVIHASSFECDPLLDGFLEQSRQVLVGVQAALERALRERWSIVLEGVHLVPGLLEVEHGDALVAQCVLRTEDEAAHALRFLQRGCARPAAKYLDRFAEIRRLQDFLVERARDAGVAVVENERVDEAVREVAGLLLASAGSA